MNLTVVGKIVVEDRGDKFRVTVYHDTPLSPNGKPQVIEAFKGEPITLLGRDGGPLALFRDSEGQS